MVTDEDIDAIIAKGEADTAALNNKLQEYTENAMKFTMDGGAETCRLLWAGCPQGSPPSSASRAVGWPLALCGGRRQQVRGEVGAPQGCRRTSTRTPTPWTRPSSSTIRPSPARNRPPPPSPRPHHNRHSASWVNVAVVAVPKPPLPAPLEAARQATNRSSARAEAFGSRQITAQAPIGWTHPRGNGRG